MNAVTILRSARDTLDHEAAWTKGEMARDATGNPVCIGSHRAVQWCALGAIWRYSESPRDDREAAQHALASILCRDRVPSTGRWSVPVWNDAPDRTHAEVLAAFDRAIEAAA